MVNTSIINTMKTNGKCPTCGRPLLQESTRLICPRGHYQVNKEWFDEIWTRFEQKGDFSKKAISALIKELRSIK